MKQKTVKVTLKFGGHNPGPYVLESGELPESNKLVAISLGNKGFQVYSRFLTEFKGKAKKTKKAAA